jgi:hypothetical protein
VSWDVFVQEIPPGVTSAEAIPDDFRLAPLGLRDDFIQRIQAFVPSADFKNPAWGVLDTPEFSVEFNMGEDEELSSFALHVRGAEVAGAFVADLLSHLGLRAFDPQSPAGIFESSASAESFGRWRRYRDEICKS